MQLYNLPLIPSTSILFSVAGSFIEKTPNILLAKSHTLQLYSITQAGILSLICIEDLFCVIRTVSAFRFLGMSKDLLVIGGDSGKLIILQFDEDKNKWRKTHEETFGKSGCRRVVPGQFIAVDPRGRALMIAAVEKSKFVYTLQRSQSILTISSPRDAHKSHTILTSLCALDTGTDNAIFACLEIDYGQVEDVEASINTGQIRKSVVFYEMDFGMGTVIRKKDVPVDKTAHMLIAVPSGSEGPGGIIILLEDYLLYRNGAVQMMVRFPLNKNRPLNRKTQFTAHCIYKFKGFFFLIASELGDIFKVQFLTTPTKDKLQVQSIKIEYFDSVSCLSSMCLSKNGYLFCASQKEDHHLYLILSREGKGQPIYTNSSMPSNQLIQFVPKELKEKVLEVTDTIQQYGPLTDLKVADLKEEGNPQIYAINASGSASYLRVIKQGLKVKELKSFKYYKPQQIFCLKSLSTDQYDRMIIMSLQTKTVVLTATATGYSQTRDTGIEEESPSIHIGRLQDDSMIQILPNGFRRICKDKTVKVMKFDGRIVRGMTKGKQMVIALAGGDIIYYELGPSGLDQVAQTTMDSQVLAFDFSPIEQKRIRSSFLAAALSNFTTVIFQLSPQRDSCLKILSMQNMKSAIHSLAIQEMPTSINQQERYGMQLYLYTGLQNGMIIRTSIDTITGKLTDSRPKYLGLKPVKCVKIQILGKPAVLALSSRPWLMYHYGKKQICTVLAFPYIGVASQIKIPNFNHTIMTFRDNFIRIISLQNFGSIFHSEKIPLQYSAKKLMVFQKNIAIIESQQRNPTILSPQKDPSWKAQVTIFSPKLNQKLSSIAFQQNQIPISMCYLSHTEQTAQVKNYLAIGCVKQVEYHPRIIMKQPCIKLYQWKNNAAVFLYDTPLEDSPLVLLQWKEKILAGVGSRLRLYDLGQKKLLRKAQLKNLSSPINTLSTFGCRIFATELNDSFHMYKYKPKEQTFYDIADDPLSRYITVSAVLDYHTVIGGDKFENIFICRVPHNAQQQFQNNPNTYKFRWQNGYLNGAPFKMQQICSFYVGQIVTSIQKCSLATSGTQLILYSTISGTIGALLPFQSRQDIDFFTHLELYMRNLAPSMGGRDHLGYRSYYSPCKGVVDGQMCEGFGRLTYQQMVEIGKGLERTPGEVSKKLEEMRNRLI